MSLGALRGQGIPSLVLPRAAGLTDLLLGAARPPVQAVGVAGLQLDVDLDELRRDLDRRLATTGVRGPVRVDGYLLRALPGPGTPRDATPPAMGPLGPFRWTAAAARRPIGLQAVRACVAGSGPAASGPARTPVEAVRSVIGDLVTEGRRGLGRPGGLPAWLCGLPAPALAAVEAAATTWATQLWTAVEWRRLGAGVEVGDTDTDWIAPVAPVRVRGRADARVPRPAGRPALLTVLPGAPGATSRVELGLSALAAALGRPRHGGTGSPPAVVVGWWPESGRALAITVDRELFEETAEAVVEAVSTLAGRRPAGGGAADR